MKYAAVVIGTLALALAACGSTLSHRQEVPRVPEFALDASRPVSVAVTVNCQRYVSGPGEFGENSNRHLDYPLPAQPISRGLFNGASSTIWVGSQAYSGRPYTREACLPQTVNELERAFRTAMSDTLRRQGYNVSGSASNRVVMDIQAVEWVESRAGDWEHDDDSSTRCQTRCGTRSCRNYGHGSTLGITVSGGAPPHPVFDAAQSFGFRGAAVISSPFGSRLHCSDDAALQYARPAAHEVNDPVLTLAERAIYEWEESMWAETDSLRWNFDAAAMVPEAADAVRRGQWTLAADLLEQAAADALAAEEEAAARAAAGDVNEDEEVDEDVGPDAATLLRDAATAALLARDWDRAEALRDRSLSLDDSWRNVHEFTIELERQRRDAVFFDAR